mmetsp:Transcript_50432/g.93110  ORF Transcript_50432/g.93110 Transcript_50432/m.93110 type:complete len:258 (+) Transcript_50432:605-1378(+)
MSLITKLGTSLGKTIWKRSRRTEVPGGCRAFTQEEGWRSKALTVACNSWAMGHDSSSCCSLARKPSRSTSGKCCSKMGSKSSGSCRGGTSEIEVGVDIALLTDGEDVNLKGSAAAAVALSPASSSARRWQNWISAAKPFHKSIRHSTSRDILSCNRRYPWVGSSPFWKERITSVNPLVNLESLRARSISDQRSRPVYKRKGALPQPASNNKPSEEMKRRPMHHESSSASAATQTWVRRSWPPSGHSDSHSFSSSTRG